MRGYLWTPQQATEPACSHQPGNARSRRRPDAGDQADGGRSARCDEPAPDHRDDIDPGSRTGKPTQKDGSPGWTSEPSEERSNRTHRSTTDPDARLLTKTGNVVYLQHMMHGLMEHHHGIGVSIIVSEANEFTQREACLRILRGAPRRLKISPRTWRLTKATTAVTSCRVWRIVAWSPMLPADRSARQQRRRPRTSRGRSLGSGTRSVRTLRGIRSASGNGSPSTRSLAGSNGLAACVEPGSVGDARYRRWRTWLARRPIFC